MAATFQSYLDTIKEKTGLGPDDFRRLAAEKGLSGSSTAAEVLAWLAADHGLGRGHGMAIYSILKADETPRGTGQERIDKQFTGAKAAWRPAYEKLLATARSLGDDVATAPTDSYVSFVRDGRKFAIVAVTASRLDLGLKLKGVEPEGRLEASGSWNSMVTHRVRVADASELDAEVDAWLTRAYEAA